MTASTDSLLNTAVSLPLPEMVYRELRKAIVNGMFLPGQMLRQEEVAARLGVSRSPLREALPRLEAEGIVLLHPRRGYAVATLDPKAIMEAFDLRILLETELSRRSVQARTEADIARVYAIVSEMATLAAQAEVADRVRWFELNTQFHNALLVPADLPQHLRALQHSRGLIESYIRTEVQLTGDLHQAQREHSELAEAFVAKNGELVVRLTREHSEHTRDRLLSGIAKSGAAA